MTSSRRRSEIKLIRPFVGIPSFLRARMTPVERREPSARAPRASPEASGDGDPQAGRAPKGRPVHDYRRSDDHLLDPGGPGAPCRRGARGAALGNVGHGQRRLPRRREEDGAIAGVTLSVFDGFTGFVSYLAAAPGVERQHIGREMMDELVRRTRIRDAKNLVVGSWLSAAAFFHRMEFRAPGVVFLVREVQDTVGNETRLAGTGWRGSML